MLFAIAVSEPRECLLLQQWNQVNTDTKRTCHNAHIIQVSILRGLSENSVTDLAQKYVSLFKYFVIFPKKESHFIYFLTKMIYWAKLKGKPLSQIQMHRTGSFTFFEGSKISKFRFHQDHSHDRKHFIIVQIALDCR